MILVLCLNGFGIRVMLASSNEFEGVTSSTHYLKSLRRLGILQMVEFNQGSRLIQGAKLKFVVSSWLANSSWLSPHAH